MKIAAIIQARDGSSRLPGKGMVDICGKPAIQRVVERVRAAKKIEDVIVAMPDMAVEDNLTAFCEKMGYSYYRGSENDVLTRVLEAARKFNIDVIVEITADCPLLDWNHVDALVELFFSGDYDHVSNIVESPEWPRTYPRGYDIRVFSRDALERTNKEVDNPVDRQHVSPWMYLNPKGRKGFKLMNMSAPSRENRPDLDITLDTPEDLELIRWLFSFEGQGYNIELTCEQVINLIDTYPGEYEKVSRIKRKDYFEELKQAYEAIEGAKKENGKDGKSGKNGKVQSPDNRSGRPGSDGGRAGKRK